MSGSRFPLPLPSMACRGTPRHPGGGPPPLHGSCQWQRGCMSGLVTPSKKLPPPLQAGHAAGSTSHDAPEWRSRSNWRTRYRRSSVQNGAAGYRSPYLSQFRSMVVFPQGESKCEANDLPCDLQPLVGSVTTAPVKKAMYSACRCQNYLSPLIPEAGHCCAL